MRVTLAELHDGADLAQLKASWLALEQIARPSFFRSWGWIGAWLDTLPASHPRLVLRVDLEGTTVGLGVLIPGRRRALFMASTRVAYLHDSPAEPEQRLAVEFNGLVCDPAIETDPQAWQDVWAEIWRALASAGIAALHLPGIRTGSVPTPTGAVAWSTATRIAPRVNLAEARGRGAAAVDLLGRNGRWQLRRALREYRNLGPVSLDRPPSTAIALEWLDRLAELHQRTWLRRGKDGAFGGPFFVAFHRQLVSALFPSGQIDLLRVAAGSEVIGYLYNFRYDGSALAYQSGFVYPDDAHLKPGLVCHALAIDQALSDPSLGAYDFLAGDSRFKRGFADEFVDLEWRVLARRFGAAHLEQELRTTARRWLRGRAA